MLSEEKLSLFNSISLACGALFNAKAGTEKRIIEVKIVTIIFDLDKFLTSKRFTANGTNTIKKLSTISGILILYFFKNLF